MRIRRWTSKDKDRYAKVKIRLVPRKDVKVNMITLSAIREKNKRTSSFLNTKIKETKLSQQEFREGRQAFTDFIEPINKITFRNYFKNTQE